MSPPAAVRATVSATIGNIACGFDVFGMAVERPHDIVIARSSAEPGVRIERIHGDGGRLPTDPARNAASAAAQAVLDQIGSRAGVILEIYKGVPLSGGLGGSAASAVAGALAADGLLQGGIPREGLLRCAIDGERAGSGAAHADNAAPALYGGIVLAMPGSRLHVVELPVPTELWAVVVHPHIEVQTQDARRVLGDEVPLAAAVTQWGNTAGFVAGLYTEDWDLIARSLMDVVAEPHRAPWVPGFPQAKAVALSTGALGCSLSGSGPSVFALCRGPSVAEAVGEAISDVFLEAAALESDVYVSPVNCEGAALEVLDFAPDPRAGSADSEGRVPGKQEGAANADTPADAR